MPRQTLRQAMTIIPQGAYCLFFGGALEPIETRITDPLLLDLTLRENLDPEGLLSDAEIWAGLEQTQVRLRGTDVPAHQ